MINSSLNQAQIKFNRILTTYLLNRKCPDSPDQILTFWQDLRNNIEGTKIQTTSVLVSFKEDFNFSRFKKLSSKYSTINFIKEGLSKEIGKFIKTFFLQGSFGTGDFLENWSDLDVMIIFNDELFKTRKNLIFTRKVLRKFSPLFYKIDPLSHHCFHLTTSLDLNYYPQTILPLVVYRNGLWLAGEKGFEIKVRDDSFEKIQDLLNRTQHFRKRIQSPPKNMVELKLDLSHLFLLPSLFLQTKGIYLYKKFSFERVKKEFPQLDFSIVDEASILRERWHTPNLVKYYPNCFIKYLPGAVNNLAVRFLAAYSRRKKIPMSDREVKEFIKKIYELYKATPQFKI